ncbi:MAG: ABC transporter ATP-binding protein [Clostridia bacterium]|nr:ABC transporter ATP-binding protein [Clostridia bacterium]
MNEKKESAFFSIRDLNVQYKSGAQTVYAVNGVSFDLAAGETLGLVGETGAGKTTIAKSILRILPPHAVKKMEGQVLYEGEDIFQMNDTELRKIRGHQISMIFQDPMTALNPVKRVNEQIAEGYIQHHHCTKAEAEKRAEEMLELVGISADRAGEYPHQFSGGMKQRVVIAMALACSPRLLIADEPTTALDVTIQAQVLDLIKRLRDELGTSMILITHDLGVVAGICDQVAVIYAGRIIEYGTKADVFRHPTHPYTIGLFGALPDLKKDVERLSPIEGLPPDPTEQIEGCAFYPRCERRCEKCKSYRYEPTRLSDTHTILCCNPAGEGEEK